jgi:hypothetical protein
MNGISGKKNFPPPALPGVGTCGGSAATVGVIASIGGGSSGGIGSGMFEKDIATRGTSTGLLNTFSSGSLVRVGIIGIAE